MNILFMTTVGLYFVATILCFAGAAFRGPNLKRFARYVLILSVVLHLVYIIWRGVAAHRLPLANQFEFATMFALMVAVFGLILDYRAHGNMEWILTLCSPMAFLLQSYAALQPKEITELMPALKSAWFGLHIGSAALSYSAFALAALVGLRYLIVEEKGDEKHLNQLDILSYKLICFGFLMLTIVIFSGCIWAEQAWSTFWSWDPKETWALITWIVYAIYLHQRFRMKWKGKRMAWLAVVAFIFVIFTFVGVNTLMSGLHSYA